MKSNNLNLIIMKKLNSTQIDIIALTVLSFIGGVLLTLVLTNP